MLAANLFAGFASMRKSAHADADAAELLATNPSRGEAT